MTIMTIRTLGDPVLRSAAAGVETFDRALASLAEDLFETMYHAPGVGLAAPQVGLSLRLFVYDDHEGAKGIVANPVLTPLEGEQRDEEGCLSIPGLYHETPRHLRVRLDGLDVTGRAVSVEAEGLLARIFQHETDHLNGVLFIDRLSEEERRAFLAALRDRELEAGNEGSGGFLRSRRR